MSASHDTVTIIRAGDQLPSPMATLSGVFRTRTTAGLILAVLLVGLGGLWGLQVALAKIAGAEFGATLGDLVFIHVVLAAIYVTCLAVRGRLFIPTMREIRFYGAAAVLANIAPLWLDLTVAPQIPAGLFTLITCMAPIFVLGLAMALRQEKAGTSKIAGILFGFAAVAVVILPAFTGSADSAGWILMALGAPLVAAVCSIYIKRAWPSERGTLQVSTGIVVAGLILLLPAQIVCIATGHVSPGDTSISPALILLTLSIAAEFYLYALIIRLSGAISVSFADFIAVFAGLFWGHALFGETPTGSVWLAAGLALAALALVCRPARKKVSAVPADETQISSGQAAAGSV